MAQMLLMPILLQPLLLLLLLGSSKVQGGIGSNKANDRWAALKEVCQSRGHEVEIYKSVTKVKDLISDYEEYLKSDGSGDVCEDKYKAAFLELKPLLDDKQRNDICTLQMYQLVRAYHTKFIHFYLPGLSSEQLLERRKKFESHLIDSPIPAALRQFFVLFVKQIDATCKQHMLGYLLKNLDHNDQLNLPTEEDYSVIQNFERNKRNLEPVFNFKELGLSLFRSKKNDDFNELEIVGAGFQESELQENDKLYVQVPFDAQLKRIKTACQMRFMPVYMELFAPAIRLNNLGYIDRTRSSFEDKVLYENEDIRRWFDIIQACEVIKDIEVLHDSTVHSAVVGIIQDNSHLHVLDASYQSKLNKVKILSREEAESLRERVDNSDETIMAAYEPKQIQFVHQEVAFGTQMSVTKPKEVKREMRDFEKDIRKYFDKRTSWLNHLREHTMSRVKIFLFQHKREIDERDMSSQLGRLTVFIEEHQNQLRVATILMTCIMVPVMFG